MNLLGKNPFETFKANDLDDQQINAQWVDINENGFYDFFSPTNPIAMYILGGKGSGKTHLMRYFSHRSQMLRHKGNEASGVANDGYFGVYFQASGLSGDRFAQLECNDSIKEAAFIYSFELWMTGLFLDALINLYEASFDIFKDEAAFFDEAISLFDKKPTEMLEKKTLKGLKEAISSLSKSMDMAINNASILGCLDFEVLVGRGALIFGIPALVKKHSDILSGVNFLYLVDELENISPFQQKYFNTLVREKKLPVTFRIGARRHGIYTFETLGSGEENKQGHEFESLFLDDIYSGEKGNYERFAIRLILNRLADSDILGEEFSFNLNQALESAADLKPILEDFFEVANVDNWLVQDNSAYLKNESTSIPLSKFKGRLQESSFIDDSTEIITWLSFPTNLIAEQAGIHLFCQEWSKNKDSNYDDLLNYARSVRQELDSFAAGDGSSAIAKKISYYKNNYVANILREKHGNNLFQYVGFDNLLAISKGFPRHILTILRHMYKQEVFLGGSPFSPGKKISIKAQQLALRESADWFYDDCITEGGLGREVSVALDRLCEILRIDVYADKPVEPSVSSFSVSAEDLSEDSIRVLLWAEKIRVFIPATPRQERNSQKVIRKYNINGLLCPRWGLPIQRRGDVSFPSDAVNSLFINDQNEVFSKYRSAFFKSRMAPFPMTEGQADGRQEKLGF